MSLSSLQITISCMNAVRLHTHNLNYEIYDISMVDRMAYYKVGMFRLVLCSPCGIFKLSWIQDTPNSLAKEFRVGGLKILS